MSANQPPVILYGPDNVPLDLTATVPPPDQEIDTFLDRGRDYPSRRLTAAKIADIFETADAGDPYEYIQLIQEMLEKDARIGSAHSTRRNGIMGVDYAIMPANDSPEAQEYADFVDSVCDEDLLGSAIAQCMDGVTFPFNVSWLTWAVVDGKNVPVGVRQIDGRHFLWAPDRDEILIRPKLGMPAQPIPAWATIRFFYVNRPDHPSRMGLARAAIYIYFFKSYAFKDWASFVELLGKPIRVMSVPRSDFDNSEIMGKLRTQLRTLGSNLSGIFPDEAKLQIITPQNIKALQESFIDYSDGTITQSYLGHDLANAAGQGSSGQLGITQAMLVRQDYLESDGKEVARTIRRDMFAPLIGFNFGWERAALAPRLSFLYERPLDKQNAANTLSVIAKTFPDLEFSEIAIRESFDVPAPQSPDDAIKGGSPAPPFGGIFGAPGPGGPGSTDEQITGEPGGQRPAMPRGEPPAVPQASRRARPPRGRAGIGRGSKIPADAKLRPSLETLDKIADRGIEAATAGLRSITSPLKAIIREAIKEGKPPEEIARSIAAAYPSMNDETFREAIYRAILLARAYGEAASPK